MLCVACARRCACSDICAVRNCAAVRDVVRACGACVCVLCGRVRCAVRGLLACGVLSDTRHDSDVPLWWVGLVASCVCARVCMV
jgi:hypothetical protein